MTLIPSRAVTKIVQPSRSRLLLHRPQLVDFLHRRLDCKLVLICASAGYGKTSLLIDFADATQLPVAWYSLDSSDGDPQVFLEYLIAAIQHRFPQTGVEPQRILTSCTVNCDVESKAAAFDAVVGALVTEMHEKIADHFAIVLDDYHIVDESAEINRLVDLLLAYLPEKAHLIISSRTMPSKLALPRLMARQQIAGLGTEELQFTAEEIRALVRQDYQVELSAQESADLAERSEGWIAGILLTTPSLSRGLGRRLVQRHRKREKVFQYLATEAFAQVDPEVQHFLLDCSVLFRMEAAMCDELRGTQNAASMLRTLEEQNLFVVRLNDETSGPYYRFNNLYHEFLRQRLMDTHPTRWRELNRRAAALYEVSDVLQGQAIAHYLDAGMPNDAAHVIERIAQPTFDSGHWTTLAHWIDSLPEEVLSAHPTLVVSRGMVFAETGKIAEAEAAYAQAIRIYKRRGDKVEAAKVVVWRAVLWRQIGRYREAVRACEHVLDILHKSKSRSDEARAYRTLGTAGAYLDDPDDVKQLEKALKLYQALRDEVRVAWLHHDIGTSLRFHGSPHADEHFRQALAYWRRSHNIIGLATTLNSIGVSYHETGRYAEALQTLEEARSIAQQAGNRRNEAFALASQGDIYRDRGDAARVGELYRQVLELSEPLKGFILTYALIALGEAYRLSNDAEYAESYLTRALDIAHAHRSDYEIGLAETAMGIWRSQAGKTREAMTHLARAVKVLEMHKPDRSRARLHLAQEYLLQEERSEARRQLLAIAERELPQGSASIPFVAADRNLIEPVIAFACSENISNGYYVPALERLTQNPVGGAHRVDGGVHIQVQALGKTRVTVTGQLVTKEHWGQEPVKELFFLLLAHPEGVRREMILESLWPNRSAGAAADSFHTVKGLLRKVIPDCVVHEHGEYRLRRELQIEYDVAQFEAFIQRAENSPDDQARSDDLERAVALYGGDYFEDSYGDWAIELRTRLRQMYLGALIELAKINAQQGNLASAIAHYQKYLEKDRDCEEVYRALMRLQFQAGDRSGAVKTYQQCARVLEDELEISSPSPETQELYEQMIRGSLVPASALSEPV